MLGPLCPQSLCLAVLTAAAHLLRPAFVAAHSQPLRHEYHHYSARRPNASISTDLLDVRRLPHPPPSTHAQIYKTEPDIQAVSFEFLRVTSDYSLLSPGYLFFTMQGGFGPSQGPQIFDIAGNLVWYHMLGGKTQDLHVCDYLGQKGKHLCVHNWKPQKEVYDQHYRMVGKQYVGERDSHEFNMLPGGRTFLTVGTHLQDYDLRPYIGRRKGRVGDAYMVEVDVKTLQVLFYWKYLDHLPIWATNLWIKWPGPLGRVNRTRASAKAGKGTYNKFWDFSHINSADKRDGDYIVSIRHLDQLIKIAGAHNKHGVKSGTVLWRLGGQGSDFNMINFNFTRQHHVRIHSVTKNETIVSIFNNAWEGTNRPSSAQSEGQIISINNVTMEAHLIKSYPHPDGVLSDSRGSTQILPDGNVVVGFGRYPDIIEYHKNGTILYHARLSRFQHEDVFKPKYHSFTYRTFLQPWVGKPYWPPKIIAYSSLCTTNATSPLIAYVSWNGATEVRSWRFRVATTRKGPWVYAATIPKTGFETQANLHAVEEHATSFTPYVSVQGLDGGGNVLGQKTTRVFIPRHPLKWRCDQFGCNNPMPYFYGMGKTLICPTPLTWTQIWFLIVLICFIETLSNVFAGIYGLDWGTATSDQKQAYQAITDVKAPNDDDLEKSEKPEVKEEQQPVVNGKPNGNLKIINDLRQESLLSVVSDSTDGISNQTTEAHFLLPKGDVVSKPAGQN